MAGVLLKWSETKCGSCDSTSTWATTGVEAPQRSMLGPLLFLIYIKDIISDTEANIHLFADDTSLYTIVEDCIQLSLVLNTDLSCTVFW